MRRLLGASISQLGLKIIATVCMLCYVISVTILQYGILRLDETDNQTLLQAMAGGSSTMGIASIAVFFELLAGVALSIFAFLLVEGFQNTSNFKFYLIRLLIFSFISEIPFDYARTQKIISFDSQNPMLALVFGLILLYGIRMVQSDHRKHILLCACLLIAAIIWCYFLRVEFGVFTVIITFAYYILRESHGWRIFTGVIVGLPMVTGILAVYPLFIYSGKRGVNYNKYIFYLIYPLSLIICSFICTQIR